LNPGRFDHWERHDDYLRLFRSAPATKDHELTVWKTFSKAVETEQDVDRPTHVAHAERAEAAPRIDELDVSMRDILDRDVMELRTEDINKLIGELVGTGEGSEQKVNQVLKLNTLNAIGALGANSSMIDRSESVSSSSTSSTSASEQPKTRGSLFKRFFSRKDGKQPRRSNPVEAHQLKLIQDIRAEWSNLSNDVRPFLAGTKGVAEVETAREETDEDDIDDDGAAKRKQWARGRK
jgi:hypothetical protein